MSNKNKLKIVIMVIIIIIIMFLAYYLIESNNEAVYEDIYISTKENVTDMANTCPVPEKGGIKIHIIGEVNNPGIYELVDGSRIQDAIIAAGGENSEADLNKVNLAYELEDGQKINIPSIFDEETAYIYNDSGQNVIVDDESITSNKKKVNINKASLEELQKINGVGPSLAEKIITYREENGKFKNIEDLKNVSGIGEKKYEALKEYITIK